jgi:hypothetical protein
MEPSFVMFNEEHAEQAEEALGQNPEVPQNSAVGGIARSKKVCFAGTINS